MKIWFAIDIERGDHGRDAAIEESDHGNVRMEGLVLGFLLIPFENLLLRGDSRAENLRIYDAVDVDVDVRKDVDADHFKTAADCTPAAIFDYRAPQICTIDVSNSASNDIQGDWDKIAELCALSVWSTNEENWIDNIFNSLQFNS